MKTDRLTRLFPAGLDVRRELRAAGCLLAAGVMYSVVTFLYRYGRAYDALFEQTYVSGAARVLRSGAVMVGLGELVPGGLIVLHTLPFFALGLGAFHLFYHRQGSRSIYLMRRLPQRGELTRRVWAFPLVLVFVWLLTLTLLATLHYLYYTVRTPAPCIPAGQLRELCSAVFGGVL